MNWELEFRRIKDGERFVYTRGSLEDCLEDALEFRRGGFHDYDATRLGFTRAEPEPARPVPGVYSADQGRAEGEMEPPPHTHTWFRNEAMMIFMCTDRLICGAVVTDEELFRIDAGIASDDILARLWQQRVEREGREMTVTLPATENLVELLRRCFTPRYAWLEDRLVAAVRAAPTGYADGWEIWLAMALDDAEEFALPRSWARSA